MQVWLAAAAGVRRPRLGRRRLCDPPPCRSAVAAVPPFDDIGHRAAATTVYPSTGSSAPRRRTRPRASDGSRRRSGSTPARRRPDAARDSRCGSGSQSMLSPSYSCSPRGWSCGTLQQQRGQAETGHPSGVRPPVTVTLSPRCHRPRCRYEGPKATQPLGHDRFCAAVVLATLRDADRRARQAVL